MKLHEAFQDEVTYNRFLRVLIGLCVKCFAVGALVGGPVGYLIGINR